MRKLFRRSAEIGGTNSRRVDELTRWSLDRIDNAFSGPWLCHMGQDGILGSVSTDLRKKILQKNLNISSGIKSFVEDD